MKLHQLFPHKSSKTTGLDHFVINNSIHWYLGTWLMATQYCFKTALNTATAYLPQLKSKASVETFYGQ